MEYYNDGTVIIRDSILHDVCELKDNLREKDKIEIWASGKHTPEESLVWGYILSEFKQTILYKGEVVGMFGAVKQEEGPAVAWLLGADGIKKMQLVFVKQTKRFLGAMVDTYGGVFNYVDAEYSEAIKWLKICGARFGPPEPMGHLSKNFRRFDLGGTDV